MLKLALSVSCWYSETAQREPKNTSAMHVTKHRFGAISVQTKVGSCGGLVITAWLGIIPSKPIVNFDDKLAYTGIK